MIIDSHCHAGKGDGLTGPWDTDAPLGAYLRRAARAGIDRTVLFAAFSSDYRSANAEVGRIVAGRPGRFSGYAMVDAGRDAGRVRAMVAEAVTGWGACGIKVHRHDARITREVCEAALSFALPVLYDVMGETSPIELVAAEYPRVAFVIPHLGSFADDWRAQRVVIDLLARHPNVYTDTSGVRRFDLLIEAVRRAGPREGALRHRRPVAASGSRALEGPGPRVCPRGSSTSCWRATGCGSRPRPGRGPGPGCASPPASTPVQARVGRSPSAAGQLRGRATASDRGDPWIADQSPGPVTGRCRAGLQADGVRGPAHLERPLGHAQQPRRAAQVAALGRHGDRDRGLLRYLADLPQANARRDGVPDGLLKRPLPPCRSSPR